MPVTLRCARSIQMVHWSAGKKAVTLSRPAARQPSQWDRATTALRRSHSKVETHCYSTYLIQIPTKKLYTIGSAIYVNSLLSANSPLYTVTLDGTPTDIDGYRPSNNFTCNTLFSQTGLDPNVQHNITLATKGASPSKPAGNSNGISVFSLINFM